VTRRLRSIACNWIEGEFNSILASLLRFLSSFDHSVRSRQHIRRDRQADLLGSLEIDHQLEFRGLLYRQIGRLGAFENFVHVDSYAPVAVCEVRPLGHEPTGLYIPSAAVHRR
jgi:hypothetical protein